MHIVSDSQMFAIICGALSFVAVVLAILIVVMVADAFKLARLQKWMDNAVEGNRREQLRVIRYQTAILDRSGN